MTVPGLSRCTMLRLTTPAILVVATVLAAGCGGEARPAPKRPVVTSADQIPGAHQTGYQQFSALCANCHGPLARGTKTGPPLLHELYVPSHHSDRTFRRAVSRGVEQHHWYFGHMPPIPAASEEQTQRIIAFVRWLQKTEGFDD